MLDRKLRRVVKDIFAQTQLTPTLPNARHWLKFYTGAVSCKRQSWLG